MNILDYIPVGRNNSKLMKPLADQLSVDPRTLRFLIQREREKGAPICSNWEQGGYFIPANENEARIYLRQQQSRIKSARAALNGVKKYLKERDNGNGQ